MACKDWIWLKDTKNDANGSIFNVLEEWRSSGEEGWSGRRKFYIPFLSDSLIKWATDDGKNVF